MTGIAALNQRCHPRLPTCSLLRSLLPPLLCCKRPSADDSTNLRSCWWLEPGENSYSTTWKKFCEKLLYHTVCILGRQVHRQVVRGRRVGGVEETLLVEVSQLDTTAVPSRWRNVHQRPTDPWSGAAQAPEAGSRRSHPASASSESMFAPPRQAGEQISGRLRMWPRLGLWVFSCMPNRSPACLTAD